MLNTLLTTNLIGVWVTKLIQTIEKPMIGYITYSLLERY